MHADVPLRFLVGAARLISIFFIFRIVENVVNAVLTFQLQVAYLPAETLAQVPSLWALYLPINLVWLGVAALTWFAAPWFCRLALGKGEKDGKAPQIKVSMNETMIFLTGGVLLVWGLIRLLEDGPKYLSANDPNLGIALDPFSKFRLYSSLALAGAGGLMMARFPSIYRWIQRRRHEGTLLHGPLTGDDARTDAGKQDTADV